MLATGPRSSEPQTAEGAGRALGRWRPWPRAVEAAAVLASPAVAFFVLRLRTMAPVETADPSISTSYVVDPRDVFTRFGFLGASDRLREGYRAGFLVPARLAYLAVGALPGYFVLRYVLALVAVVPAYVLLRRLYGIGAGALGIAVMLSSPVLVTAWGTDYPDSALVSYAAGAIACLAMPSSGRGRLGWVGLGGALLALGAWSHGVGIVLAAAAVVAYLVVGLVRARDGLLVEIALLAATGIVTTLVLMLGSALVIGPFDIVGPTLHSAIALGRPSQVRHWHSSNRDWVFYDTYLLVPLGVLAGAAALFVPRLRALPTAQLFVGLACLLQVAAFALLQFVGHLWALEYFFFSSTLWGGLTLLLSIVLAEMCRPCWRRAWTSAVPAVVVVGMALSYETDSHVPALGWWPIGAVLAAVPVVVAVGAAVGRGRKAERLLPRFAAGVVPGVVAVLAVVATAGSLLILSVAPDAPHSRLPGVVGYAHPPYAGALGGSDSSDVAWYQVSTGFPAVVGHARYDDEQVMMWYPERQHNPLLEVSGIFHAHTNSLAGGFPVLSSVDRRILTRRRPAELALMTQSASQLPAAYRALQAGGYEPSLLRTRTLRSGPVQLHVWVVVLRRYARRSVWPAR